MGGRYYAELIKVKGLCTTRSSSMYARRYSVCTEGVCHCLLCVLYMYLHIQRALHVVYALPV